MLAFEHPNLRPCVSILPETVPKSSMQRHRRSNRRCIDPWIIYLHISFIYSHVLPLITGHTSDFFLCSRSWMRGREIFDKTEICWHYVSIQFVAFLCLGKKEKKKKKKKKKKSSARQRLLGRTCHNHIHDHVTKSIQDGQLLHTRLIICVVGEA